MVTLPGLFRRYYLLWVTFSDALDNLTLIFQRLRSYGLQLKSTECHLFQASVPFLGHIVGRRGLEYDPVKIEDVMSWPVPDCLKSVHQFLGFVGYYRRFIPNFADIATPMVALTGKDVAFAWDLVCSTAFYTLRDSLIHAPMKPDSTSWTLTPVTLGWAVSSVRSRVMWNVWLIIVAAPFDPRSDVIAPLNGICWLLWLCVFSSGRIYVRVTSPWCGYIGSKTWRV